MGPTAAFARFALRGDLDAAEATVNLHRDRAQLGDVLLALAHLIAMIADPATPEQVDDWLTAFIASVARLDGAEPVGP